MASKQLAQAFEILQENTNTSFHEDGPARAEEHLSLIREWNHAISLVSQGDLAFLTERHLVDSLSLAPYLGLGKKGAGLLDIGSGAGFPAIPLKCFYPELPVLCIERSVRKVGFLQRVIATLGLVGIEVIPGEFPEHPSKIEASCITARAVERPRQVYNRILQRLPGQCTFLCQLEGVPSVVPGKYSSETVSDLWEQSGLRRGSLQLIRRV